MSRDGVLVGRRAASPSFETAPARLAQALQLRDLAIDARAVFDAFREQYEAGSLPRLQHAALHRLEQRLKPFPGHAGVASGAVGSAGARPPGTSDREGVGQAPVPGSAAATSRGPAS